VTVHGTNNLRVENNVTYNTVGHCYFLEDGIETGNQFVRNLGIQTKCHTSLPCNPTNLAAAGLVREATGNGQAASIVNGDASAPVVIPSDNTVSTFWVTHPDNTYRDNVAAGSTRSASGWPFRSTRSDSSKARRSARTPGRAGCRSASSRAMSPTRTLMV
jgi:cell migration-inducing and hyaluronan-binding protein